MTADVGMSAAALAPKADPETLAIRSRPERAIRFKRGVVIGLVAAGSVSVATIAWVALKPTSFRMTPSAQELSEASPRASSDALGRLPASYGSVPKLGPPLPGDLGRPILEHQRAMATEGAQPPATVEQQALTDRERRESERRSALQSPLLVQTAARPGEAGLSANTGPSAMPTEAAAPGAEVGPARQANKADFVSSTKSPAATDPHTLASPISPYTLNAGSVIAASFITGLNSDVPGIVTAQVTQNCFDSATGRILLVPQGSRLIGTYDSMVAFGQRRALVIWQRIIRPDGSSLTIDNVPATDAAGYAGLSDKVDFHTWQLLKGIGLSTLLGIGTELSISGDSDLVRAIRQSTQQNVARAGDQIVTRTLDIQPTIVVRPGSPVRLLVHKDLVFTPWRGGER